MKLSDRGQERLENRYQFIRNWEAEPTPQIGLINGHKALGRQKARSSFPGMRKAISRGMLNSTYRTFTSVSLRTEATFATEDMVGAMVCVFFFTK
ncbi:hypothetical protein Nepgr_024577 [Nepenthes gracilis]|uniref:Uncharacterized protein n=1 Tax=Nepenthes gracilis TaxID=150966 RepID=A0AAD3T4T2_NEPGR|nr:hypothetical protein Nepgr_024577 [Nepenthes gracilis]